MLLVARKNLLSERTRLAISAGGVALSVLLIALLLSLYRGWSERVGGWVEKAGVDVWIAREGTTDFLAAASILPLEEADALSTLRDESGNPEVREWRPLVVRPMAVKKGDKEMDVHLVGYDTESGLGGPLRVVEGKAVPGPGEVIVDTALARRFGVKIGDSLEAAGHAPPLKVVGKSSGGDFIASQLIFVPIESAIDMLKLRQDDVTYVTFFLVELVDPSEAELFTGKLQKLQPEILAVTGSEFATATRDRILSEILPILSVVLLLAFIVGLAVSGLTIYAATIEKSREYGILKAVGFSNGYLYRTVFEQSLAIALLGFIIGVGLTLVAAPFAEDQVAQFVVFIRWQDLLAVAGITLLMALIAAYVPVRHLANIDPVTVFKA